MSELHLIVNITHDLRGHGHGPEATGGEGALVSAAETAHVLAPRTLVGHSSHGFQNTAATVTRPVVNAGLFGWRSVCPRCVQARGDAVGSVTLAVVGVQWTGGTVLTVVPRAAVRVAAPRTDTRPEQLTESEV